MPYPLAPPQGWEASLIFEKIALSKWQLANPKARPENRSTLRQIAGNRWVPRQSGMAWDDVAETHANLG